MSVFGPLTGIKPGQSLGLVPEQFGAKANGTTDDYVALQACIDAMAATGVPVTLSAKTYATSKPLILRRPSVTVRHPQIYGMGEILVGQSGRDSGSTIKMITATGSDNAAVIATDTWMDLNTGYFGGIKLENFTIDGNGIAQQGVVTNATGTSILGCRIEACTQFGLHVTNVSRTGVATGNNGGHEIRFNNIKDCAIGFQVDAPAADFTSDSTLFMNTINNCGIALEVLATGGWIIAYNRMWSLPGQATGTYLSHIVGGARIIANIFGSSQDDPELWNLVWDVDFGVSSMEFCNVSGGGKGLLVNFLRSKGLAEVRNCNFGAGGTGDGFGQLWNASDDPEHCIRSINNVFRNQDTTPPYMWLSGATTGNNIWASNDVKMDQNSNGFRDYISGWQVPNGLNTSNPGVTTVTAASPYAIVPSTRQTVRRDATYVGTYDVLLPASPADGQTCKVVRGPLATGGNLLVKDSTGTTTVATLAAVKTSADLVYDKVAGAWAITQQSAW